MGIPKDKYTEGSNSLAVFAALPPSGDGTVRAASSDFPAQVDSFVIFEDDADEKLFAEYLHTFAASIIKTQEIVLAGGGGGGGILESHAHAEISTVYSGVSVILLPGGRQFKSNTTQVYLRGRKIVKGVHYVENGNSKGITLTLDGPCSDLGATSGDKLDILFIEDLVVPSGDHIHESAYHLFDGGSLITFLSTQEFVEGSTEVFLRGRKVIRGLHYIELPNKKSIQLTLTFPEGAAVNDTIEINYRIAV